MFATDWAPKVVAALKKDRKAHGAAGDPKGPTVLLVDDEPAINGLLAQALNSAGYRVLQARNGPEAIDLAEAAGQPIDLLLTDIMMPMMSGADLSDALRARHPDLKVLFISGYLPQALLRSDCPFLQKPFDRAALLHAVETVLNG